MMIDWMILAAVKIVKMAVLGLVALATSFVPEIEPADAQAALAPPAPEMCQAIVLIELQEIESPAAVVTVEIPRMAPPIRIETILTPDLLVPPKVRDLSF